MNDSFTAINRLLAASEEVSWLRNGPMGQGTFYVAAKPTTRAILQKATELGVSFQPATTAPSGFAAKLRKPRIALFDTYGGGMPSGWTRLVFENFEFPYEVVFPPDLDKGGLRAKYERDRVQWSRRCRPVAEEERGGRGGGAGAGRQREERGAARGRRRAGGRRPRGIHAAADSRGVRAAPGQRHRRDDGEAEGVRAPRAARSSRSAT